MSDFSALIASVQSYIRQNGNNEITGSILQEVLVGIINTLGTQSINALETGLSTEQTTRANADTALGGRIDTEVVARQQADTALGGRIDGLVGTIGDVSGIVTTLQTRLDEGFLYKGIATPTTNPSTPTGKVFYVAVQAGTYTNFGGLTVSQGINILSYNGATWEVDTVIAIDNEPTEGSTALMASGGTHAFIKANTLEETHAEIVDEGDIAEYLVDKNNVCFGYVKKDGTVHLRHLSFTSTDNEIINRVSSPSPYDDPQVLKYLVDDNNICFGYIKTDGTVVINKAHIDILEGQIENAVTEEQLSAIVGLVAVGVDNIEMSNKPKMMGALNNLFTDKQVEINAENQNKVNLKPCMSIIDDDTIDNQIPSSQNASQATQRTGGYFSVLLPFTLSLKAKHSKPFPACVACEGQRVGLTPLYSSEDNYSELNENGRAVKFLHDNVGWNVFNHSMTAQLPIYTYYVDGIDSELADTILAAGNYVGPLRFSNTIVLDRLTGRWYEVNSTLTAWVERTPTKKYAMPFYRDYNNGKWYFNRDFDFEYSWGEWCKRADELGLPYEKAIVHNGATSSVYTAYAGRKYAYFSVRTTGTYNNPPIPATVNRANSASGLDYNVWSDEWVADKMQVIENCIADKSWVVIMSHFNDQTSHRNYYLDGRDYPSADPAQPALRAKDDNYPEDWIIPLNHEEIQDIIGDNVHDYINHPPSRLGINSWSEWHPAGGTQLAALYYIFDQAMSSGIDIVTPMDGWATHGNILNIGVDRNGQSYTYDSAAEQVPYTDEEKSYLTIGGDMSIRYYNSKS